MSGSESDREFPDDDRDEDERASEEELLRLRALIETVRPCPALYAKNKKQYSGKNFNKDLAWTTVGQAQIPPLEGPEAKSQFYKLRQRFGKEWRKYQLHQKGKSGQGALAPYESNWPLFEDWRFLGDHITPRKTKSSYTTPLAKKPVGQTLLHRNLKLGVSTSSTPSPASDTSLSSLWNSDVEYLMSSGSNETEADDGPSPAKPTASEQVLQAMEKAVKTPKRVPEPDGFASKRQKSDKEFMDNMMEQGKALTKVAVAFGKALEAPSTLTAPPPPPVLQPQPEQCPVLVAIKFALQSVPEDEKLACMTDILNLIATKYGKK